MNTRRITFPLALLLALLCRPALAEGTYEQILTRAEWPEHATSQNLLALPAVREVLQRFREAGTVRVVIWYPGGDPGHQWARQLRDQLIAFGISSGYLELHPGAGAGNQLVVSVIDRGK